MARLLAVLLASTVVVGCSAHHRATSAGDARVCEGDMRLITATNTSNRYMDLMYGSANLGMVSPGQTVRITVKGTQSAYFRQTPMVTNRAGRRETSIAPYLTCA